jgi:hypothetical protein
VSFCRNGFFCAGGSLRVSFLLISHPLRTHAFR